MDRARPPNSRETKAASYTSLNTSRNKWSSNFTFGRIISNLEKSFMQKFSSSDEKSNSSSSKKSTIKSEKSSSRANSSNKAKSHSSSSNGQSIVKSKAPLPPPPQKPVAAANSNENSNDKRDARAVSIPKVQHHFNAVNSISSPSNKSNFNIDHITADKTKNHDQAPNINKNHSNNLEQNKFLHQSSSTLRPSQLLVNNKPSIPPPHANDEARNQSHRLLFGYTATDQKQIEQDSRQACISNSGDKLKRDGLSSVIESTRPSSSPASSAKSLPPNLANRGSQQDSSFTKKTIGQPNDDEDSGFITYQSQRLLQASNNNSATFLDRNIGVPKVGEEANSANKSSQTNNNNNMFLIPANQVPFGSFNFNQNNLTHQQMLQLQFQLQFQLQQQQQQRQYVYNYQHLNPTIIASQHQPLNTRAIILGGPQHHMSNQVPIGLDGSQFTSPNSYHLFNQRVMQPNGSLQDARHFDSYNNQISPNITPRQSFVDNGQQIYANAPPKPRRYQYYDMKKVTFDNEMNMNAPVITNMNGPLISVPNNQIPQTQRPNNHQNIYMSYQNVSQIPPKPYNPIVPENHKLQQVNQELQRNSFYVQQRMTHAPHLLSRSKSNLDASHLARIRLSSQGDQHIGSSDQSQAPIIKHQPIYGSHYGTVGRSSDISYANQNQEQTIGNLHRSKSVNHLLQLYGPTHSSKPSDLVHQPANVSTSRNKFRIPVVSSLSSTNLNQVGLNFQGQETSNFIKVPSCYNMNLSQTQDVERTTQLRHQFRELSIATCPKPNQNLIGQQSRPTASWAGQNHMATNYANDFKDLAAASVPANSTSVLTNNGKLARQSPSDSFIRINDISKPSLDDKIRHLLLDGGDIGLARGVTNSYDNEPQSSSAGSDTSAESSSIRHQHGFGNVISNHSMSSIASNQNLTLNGMNRSSSQLEVFTDSINQLSNSGRIESIRGINSGPSTYQINSSEASKKSRVNLDIRAPLDVHKDEFENTKSIFVQEVNSNMGNRQPRSYQVGREVSNDNTDKTTYRPENIESSNKKSEVNSYLIVDLTTPRVLAKTQTTLMSSNNQLDSSNKKQSWSIEEVGLPQMLENKQDLQATPASSIHINSISGPDISYANSTTLASSTSDLDQTDSNAEEQMESNDSVKREAPYYYSDLRSAEQRQALLTIVEQKRISPPPQLLSRSTDHSNTRLGPINAMHLRSSEINVTPITTIL